MTNVKQIRAFSLEEDNKLLVVLDQTKLPTKIEYINIRTTRDGWTVIKDMNVRGAPCIAAVACLSIMVELKNILATCGPLKVCQAFRVEMASAEMSEGKQIIAWLRLTSAQLKTSRPTAVNLGQALDRLLELVDGCCKHMEAPQMILAIEKYCLESLEKGEEANRRLGGLGAERLILMLEDKPIRMLTHCNTGSLATVGYGTALGVIRSLHSRGKLQMAYCTETRPYNQGSRLTAWELVQETIPATLIADSMVASLMAQAKVDAVIVGADRVASNGDTANKIGTFQIACLAKMFKIPFLVAAPIQTVDLETTNGTDILIEERPKSEMLYMGALQLAPQDVNVWNPCFDVTPGKYIDLIITDNGIWPPEGIKECKLSSAGQEGLF